MIHLIPTLDHVVVNVRDRADEAAETWRRLGFTLTPRGHHTLGSVNHLAIFGTDYLELLGLPAGSTARPELMEAPAGLNGIVFGTEDAEATRAALVQAELPVHPIDDFSRPVALSEGTFDAVFRTVRLKPEAVPSGRLYFCQHKTRHLVWRDEWRHHANGVAGVARAIFAAEDPTHLGHLFARMFGPGSTRSIEGGRALTVGLSRVDILTPAALRAEFGDAVPDPAGRSTYMAALALRTRSLDATARALEGVAGVRREADRIVVPASDAFGTALAFCL